MKFRSISLTQTHQLLYKMKPIHLQIQHKKLPFLIILVFVMQNITTTTSALLSIDNNVIGNETDHTALMAIKAKLSNPSNNRLGLTSWNDSIHHCFWEGITCGRKHKRVTILDLNSRGLTGTISPFIGNLTFLNTISLYNNSLHGEIPDQITRLFRLQRLSLENNTFTGEIPANISNCVDIRNISLAFNKLEGKLPTGLRALSKLEELLVHHNQLTGPLFDIIQNITSLKTISAIYNSFEGSIPYDIGRTMRNLINLGVGVNELSGTLPSSLFNISSLEVVDLIFNQLHGEIPADIGFNNLPRLKWLNLVGNKFSGSIPVSILNLTTLEEISLGINGFTGRVPSDFGRFRELSWFDLTGNPRLQGDISFLTTFVNCSRLRILQLGPNDFTGSLPESVANLSTSLTTFMIIETPISGRIPEGITNLNNLECLALGECEFTGSLPRDFGKLHKLERLYLQSNKLEGTIPTSLGNLSHLSKVYLDHNEFEGGIPTHLGNHQSLLYLTLRNNKLNGSLSSELFEGSASFVELDFSHNHLQGFLPSEISKQSNLELLRLSDNKFTGVVPDGLGECSDLQYLYMDGNFFQGRIPASFASLGSLQEIDFSRNNLSGPIPAFFSEFTKLYYLNLSYNDFEGRVPTNAVFANASAVVVTGNNRLCGGIKQLGLPMCIEKKKVTAVSSHSHSHSLQLIIIPIIIVGVVIIAVGLYLSFFRTKRKPLFVGGGLLMGDVILRVSYDMLLKATAGFSSENLLGRGSFGSVYKGILGGNTVAVKVLNLEHHGASKSFMAECKTLKNVRHRNLVSVITACSSIDFQRNDFRALVYEFMPNGSLDRWLLHGTTDNNGNMMSLSLSLAQRVDLAIDVAHALIYLHHECEIPIVHCDLKPSNVLLDHDMVAHVGDFGLARFLTHPRHPNQTSSIGIKGTIGYAAPEYGLGSEPSTEGDVYSFGILLLELMTGRSPTDDMFNEGYNLHLHAEAALPDRVLQILDPSLAEANDSTAGAIIQDDQLQRRLECITSMISVGVLCSYHLPQERINIVDATRRLQSTRDNFINARNKLNLPARI